MRLVALNPVAIMFEGVFMLSVPVPLIVKVTSELAMPLPKLLGLLIILFPFNITVTLAAFKNIAAPKTFITKLMSVRVR